MKKLSSPEMDKIILNIRNITKNYLQKNSLRSVVIGVSGGIDSALVCALLKPVCDELKIPLIGRSITIESNKKNERERAKQIGNLFCTNFKEVNLTDEFKILHRGVDMSEDGENYDERYDEITYNIRMGNIMARMRMIYLYNLASRNGGLVMGTENTTEHYLGFCTLHGDSGTDFEPIIGLWKTEVYDIAEYLCAFLEKEKSDALMNCINCDATDGLGISSTDLDQILPDWKDRHKNTRTGYEEVDDIFNSYFNSGELIDTPVIQRYLKSDFKRNSPYIIKREEK